jgi:succinate dehydrogenase/fumarate reductase flavoprotein subunit
MARINVAIADELNEWLANRSKEMHISKTALVNLALEQYMQSYKVISQSEGLGELVKKMQEIEKALNTGELKVIKAKE